VESRLEDAAINAALPADFMRDPYPYFAQKRNDASVFHGTVVDYSKTPESLRPEKSFAAMSFDAVNKALRDGQVFSSTYYDNTIGLFIGPTILAMEGKKHREHRNVVSAAFKSKALARWEPTVVQPICDALIDGFIDAGEADLVRNFAFEFPTRVIAKLLGLPANDLPTFRRRAEQFD
jgi:cytochrome P450